MTYGRFLIGLLVFGSSLAGADAEAAGRVFYDGFESTDTSRWDADGSRDRCTVVQVGVDQGSPHSGNGMLQCNWDGTVTWTDPRAETTLVLQQSRWNYQREFFIRAWLRYDADVAHTFGGKVLRLYPVDHNNFSFCITSEMQASGGPELVFWEWLNGKPGPEYWGTGTVGYDHAWHKIEIYMNHSSSPDGSLKVWIDGQLVQQATNLVTGSATSKWGPLYLNSNWSNNGPQWAHGAHNHTYWDEVEIYTDLGTGATGSMSDASIRGTGGEATSAGPVPAPPQTVTVK
jgi:hypothetical protein